MSEKNVNTRLLVVGLLIFTITVFGLPGYGQAAEQKGFAGQFINFGASQPGGSYFALAGGMAKIWNEKMGTKCSVTSTAGSIANVKLVDKKEMDVGFANAANIYDGYNGLEKWTEGKKYQNVRMLMFSTHQYVQIVTMEKSGIKSIFDLEGKRISIGAPGGHESLGRAILGTLNIKPKDIVLVPLSEVKDLLSDGRVDAIMLPTVAPSTEYMELEATHKVRIFGLQKADVEKLQAKLPYFSPGDIPKGSYKNNPDTPIPSAMMNNALIGNKDLPEKLAYELVKSIYDNMDIMIAAHVSAKSFDIQDNKNCPIPLHVGSVKYFQEKGIKVDNALPPELKK